MSGRQNLHIAQAASVVINHMHAPLTLARRGSRTSGDDNLPTVYMLDVRELLRVSAEAGLTIIPWRDGEPRAFVFLATRSMREWVQAQVDGGHPLWLPAAAAPDAPAVGGEPQ